MKKLSETQVVQIQSVAAVHALDGTVRALSVTVVPHDAPALEASVLLFPSSLMPSQTRATVVEMPVDQGPSLVPGGYLALEVRACTAAELAAVKRHADARRVAHGREKAKCEANERMQDGLTKGLAKQFGVDMPRPNVIDLPPVQGTLLPIHPTKRD